MEHSGDPALPSVALRVFDTLPICCLVLSPQLYILNASNEYLTLTGNTREALTGQYLFDVFPKTPTWNTGQYGSIEESLQQVLATKQPHSMALTRFDIPDPANGKLKECYWETVHQPVLDEQGEISYIIHKTRDVSAHVIDKHQLIESLQAERMTRGHADSLSRQMEALFQSIPAQIAILDGPDMVYSYINPQYKQELFPNREVLGIPLLTALPEIANAPILQTLKNIYLTGEPYSDTEICVPLAEETGGELFDHYFNVVYQPLRDAEGNITGILSFKYEITEHVAARKLLELSERDARYLNDRLQQAYEEQQATNEELLSSNEEMAATNEELKQAQDELRLLNDNLEERIGDSTAELRQSEQEQQALNEELTAINEELSSANDELIAGRQLLEEHMQRLSASEQEVRSLVGSAPFPIAVYTGPEMRIKLFNQAIVDTWQRGSDLTGKTYAEVLPELAGTGVYEALDQVYHTGIPYRARKQRVDLMVDGELQPYYFNYDFTPLFDTQGNVYGVMNTAADVSDLVTATLGAEQSRRQLYNIIMRSPVSKSILLGEAHVVDIANDRIVNLWGRTRDTLTDRPFFEALPEAKGQGLEEALRHVYLTGETIEANEQPVNLLRYGQMETLYLNLVYQPYRDAHELIIGVIINAIDVTDQVEARNEVQQLNEELAATNEELQAANDHQTAVNERLETLNSALQRSQDDLQLAVEAAGLGTWDLNPHTGRFAGNDITKSWFGLQPEEEIELGKAISAVADEDREFVANSIAEAMVYASGGYYDILYTIQNPLGEQPRTVRAKGKALFDEQQRATRLSGVLFDVTEQKKDEQRKNDFIGMASHELKTPLTSIKALVQLAEVKLRQTDDTFLQEAIRKSGVQIRKMEGMINGFLNISRLESGKIAIQRSAFDLEQLLNRVIQESTLTSSAQRIDFRSAGPITVNADQDKIDSVVSNLIGNAIKYSPRESEITVTLQNLPGKVRISVTDQGLGISKEDQQRIFERYYRVVSPGLKHISGFGIGLYLSAEIIQHHGGRIGVESEPDKGSTFFFELPLAED